MAGGEMNRGASTPGAAAPGRSGATDPHRAYAREVAAE